MTKNVRTRRRRELCRLAWLFLRLGATAFGGPAAHIALMREEVVRRRSWLTDREFLDLLGATQLIPGPNSTEMAMHIGWRRAGMPGLLVAGICFILPSALMVTALARAYVRLGHLPQVEALLHGVKPVILAIVARALWDLGRQAIQTPMLAVMAACAAALAVTGLHELTVLFGTAAAVAVLSRVGPGVRGRTGPAWAGFPFAGAAAVATEVAVAPVGLWPLFFFFLKVGAVLFGSGYVLLAYLRADLVERWQWLTEAQLLDAVAAGQVTPGPVLTTAAFVGYLLAGLPGAAVATAGIFLPAFVLVALTARVIERLRTWALLGRFLDGLNVASWALMGVVTWQLGRTALSDAWTVMLAGVTAVMLFVTRLNPTWYILAGALLGLIVQMSGETK